VVLSVGVRACVCSRFVCGCLRGRVGGLRVVFMGAGGGVGLSVVVSNLTLFVGFWVVGSRDSWFGLEDCLFRFLVVCVLVRGRVVLKGSAVLCCGSRGCVLL
jgi:hypothetical protein